MNKLKKEVYIVTCIIKNDVIENDDFVSSWVCSDINGVVKSIKHEMLNWGVEEYRTRGSFEKFRDAWSNNVVEDFVSLWNEMSPMTFSYEFVEIYAGPLE